MMVNMYPMHIMLLFLFMDEFPCKVSKFSVSTGPDPGFLESEVKFIKEGLMCKFFSVSLFFPKISP